ncbi:MAG: hypothetical protein JST32_15485 [Bacteroidetes bacterium]|nr:hypothetical protein [Bacteroidota bacterium]
MAVVTQRWFLANNGVFLDMGYKNVCLSCRKAFSMGLEGHNPQKCPECGNDFIRYNHKFRPPKRDDLKAWQIISFLHQHGFTYQHVYKDVSRYQRYKAENQAEYPSTLEEAKEFVVKYKSQAQSKVL